VKIPDRYGLPMQAVVRRRFDEAAATFDSAAVLHAEARTRLLERLALFRLEPERVLDVGTATGAGSAALGGLYPRAQVIAIDTSLAMARRAATNAPGAASLVGDAHELPIEDHSVDLVFANLLLPWVEPHLVLAEFARVLRPGGALVVNTCTRDQLRNAYWYWQLVPDATERFCRCFAPLETLRDAMAEAGFVYQDRFVPLDSLCQGEAYFDGRGPLDPVWRNGDSFWAVLTDDELEQALARLRALDAAGRLDAFMAEHDAGRRARGQITFLFARRAQAG